MSYTGGKNGSGTYQAIINLIPPHETYIELFLGSGAVIRRKKPAQYNIGIDLNPAVVSSDLSVSDLVSPDLALSAAPDIRQQDAFSFLESGELINYPRPVFIYADPPYLREVRSSNRAYYEHELFDQKQHERLFDLLNQTDAMVMLSGYPSQFYDDHLEGWHTCTFNSMTRGGVRIEKLWMNYPRPTLLHDYSYVGNDYRERERIKRKVHRWCDGLERLPDLERQAILSAIEQRYF
jgi:site-specific DNA-adenine methylase